MSSFPAERGRIWIVSELYYPEETSTGYLVTKIAEGLAETHEVHAICAQPTYAVRGLRAPVEETHNDVRIHRCPSTTFDRTSLLLRVINMVTISVSVFFSLVRRIGAGDIVIVVTNPPALPFVVAVASSIRRARRVLLVHDVYPDALVAAGLTRESSIGAKWMESANRWLYGCMDAIVALGRDMRARVAKKLHGSSEKVHIIPNWADLELVEPQSRNENELIRELRLEDRFILQYAGNMGRTHGLEELIEAARRLDGNSRGHFVFVGSGAKEKWVRERAEELGNVTVLGQMPRSRQPVFLNACDVAVISFRPGMAGVSVPSRMYNVMAAGRPIIAISDPESELARVVEEERIGWTAEPGNLEKIIETIRMAEEQAAERTEMGKRAREAAESRYSYDVVKKAYDELVTRHL